MHAPFFLSAAPMAKETEQLGMAGAHDQGTATTTQVLSLTDILERLHTCDAVEFENLCVALAQHVPRISPADAPQLVNALVSALQTHLGPGNDHAVAGLLDEVCGSWTNTQMLPEDALRSLLRVLLRGLRTGVVGECRLHRSKSTPARVRLLPFAATTPQRRGSCDLSTECAGEGFTPRAYGQAGAEGCRTWSSVAGPPHRANSVPKIPADGLDIPPDTEHSPDTLPVRDARLLQAMVRLVGTCSATSSAGAADHGHEAAPLTSRKRPVNLKHIREGSSSRCVSLDDDGRRSHASSIQRRRPPTPGGGTEFHDLADGDSIDACSDCAGYSEASFDWCFRGGSAASVGNASADTQAISAGLASPDPRERGATHIKARSQLEEQKWSGGRRGQGQMIGGTTLPTVLCRRRRAPRCRSLPAQTRPSSKFSSEDEEEDALSVVPGVPNLHDPAQQLDRLVGRHAWEECVQMQHRLQTQCSELRQSQLAVVGAVQETARMVHVVHEALQEERFAREAERQTQEARHAEVNQQLGALMQGQMQLQQCMMALCSRVAEAPPATTAPPAPAPSQAEPCQERLPPRTEPGQASTRQACAAGPPQRAPAAGVQAAKQPAVRASPSAASSDCSGSSGSAAQWRRAPRFGAGVPLRRSHSRQNRVSTASVDQEPRVFI